MRIKRRKDSLTALLFLLPSLGVFWLFIIFPVATSLILSLCKWDILRQPEFVGFDNFTRLFHDPIFWEALRNTFYYIGGYTPLSLVGALGLASLMNKSIRGLVIYRTAYFMPVISTWVAVALVWRWLYNPEIGAINYILSFIGIKGPAWLEDMNWAMPGVIFASVWKDLGFNMVILLAGLQAISPFLYEVADIDGASAWKKFAHITLPMLSPAIFFLLVISLINSFQVFDQIYVMTRGGPAGATSVLVFQIYQHAFNYLKMGYAAAISWILFILVFIATAIQIRYQRYWVQYGE